MVSKILHWSHLAQRFFSPELVVIHFLSSQLSLVVCGFQRGAHFFQGGVSVRLCCSFLWPWGVQGHTWWQWNGSSLFIFMALLLYFTFIRLCVFYKCLWELLHWLMGCVEWFCLCSRLRTFLGSCYLLLVISSQEENIHSGCNLDSSELLRSPWWPGRWSLAASAPREPGGKAWVPQCTPSPPHAV